MKLDQFAVWKFKALDGILKGFSAGDIFTSKYVDKKGQQWKITYDIRTNKATVTLVDMFSLETGKSFSCSFKDLEKTLKDNDMYEERQDNRHSSSYIKFEGNLEEI